MTSEDFFEISRKIIGKLVVKAIAFFKKSKIRNVSKGWKR